MGGSLGMSNSDQNCRVFIQQRNIIHPGFPHKGKRIAQRNSPRKAFLRKKNQKESNKLIEKPKYTLISLPQGREDTEIKKRVQQITDHGHPKKLKISR